MKILFKTLFGSHLYGTETPASDKDYKAVYMSTMEDILLKRDKETIQENTKSGTKFGVRNTKDDIDCEYIELRKFLKDAQNGQTYALDMIFTPEYLWLETSSEWQDIVDNKNKLLSKNVAPYIGYCRQQAGKYGLKGSRLGELVRVIDHLETFDPKTRLEECLSGFKYSEFVQRYKSEYKRPHAEAPIMEDFFDVLGKKFQMNRFVHEVLFSLKKMNAVYGDRAREAMDNKGVDWKAISHAFRCCYQLLELAQNHHIQFPLAQAKRLKDIKTGKIPYKDLGDNLYELMEEAKRAVEVSTLPEKTDREFWEQFIINTYLCKR